MRIEVISFLRGIAAISVCLFHFVNTTRGYITHPEVRNVFSLGHYGVEVFFIISSIVIPLSMISANYTYNSFPGFLARRFVRIEPPYFAAILIGVIYLNVRNMVPGSAPVDLSPSLGDVALHAGYLVPFVKNAVWINPVFWTLSVEFQYYLALALIFPLVMSASFPLRCGFYLVLLLGPFLVESVLFFPHWSAYFGLGILYILHETGRIKDMEYRIVFLLCCYVVYLQNGSVPLMIALGTLVVVNYFRDFSYGKFLGDISYSLYLLHSVIGTAFINFMAHRFTAPFEKFLVISGGVTISILSASLFYFFLERPCQRWSKQIKY